MASIAQQTHFALSSASKHCRNFDAIFIVSIMPLEKAPAASVA